jgi:Flp pilus assembly pilin Flp
VRNARHLRDLIKQLERERPDLVLEYLVIVGIIVVVVVLVFGLMGDSISDLVSLIGGRVDEATVIP